jgi:hypothetical protein
MLSYCVRHDFKQILNKGVLDQVVAVNNQLYTNFWSELQIDLKCKWRFKFALSLYAPFWR